MANTSTRELRERASLPVKDGGMNTLREFLKRNERRIEAQLPSHLTADRMLAITAHAVRNTPILQRCTTESIVGAAIQCSQLGLEPNDVRGLAYLVPFKNNSLIDPRSGRRGVYEAQMIVGYRGYIDLARRSGEVEWVMAHEVFEREHCRIVYGTEQIIEHEPCMSGDPGELIGAYAIARMRNGRFPLFQFMNRYQLEEARKMSKGAFDFDGNPKKGSPWWDHFGAMGMKTCVRRLQKWLPMSIEWARAVALDQAAELGESQHNAEVLDGEYSIMPNADDVPNADDDDDGEPQGQAEQSADTERYREHAGDHQSQADSKPAGESEGDAKPSEEEEAASIREDISSADTEELVYQHMEYAKAHLSGGYLSGVTRTGNARLRELRGDDEDGESNGGDEKPSNLE